MNYCIFTIFPSVKVKTYWGNKTYWRLLQNHYITLSNTVLKNDLIYTHIFNEQAKYSSITQNFFISLQPSNRLLQL
jgi:hypothetical protein